MLVDHSYFQISASSSLMMMTIRKKRSIVDNIWIYTGWNDKYCIYQFNEYNYKYRNVLCQFCQKKNKVSILRASGNMLQRQVKEEIELCNFLKCHSTSRKRVQHQILIQCESFWPSRSCICQKLISPGNSRFLTCCENIWPPRSLSYLSTNFSLVILFFVCSLSICWRWFSESLTLLETGPSTLVDQSFKTKVKRCAHKNEESHLAAGEQKIIVIALSSNQLNCT